MSNDHTLNYSLTLGLPLAPVFEFFADAGNLQLITPPELQFSILTPLPIEMRAGTLIDYHLKLMGIPFTWRTEIAEWNPPFSFVDVQLKGPYDKWVHRHTFTEGPEGTVVNDEVSFRLPLLPLGEAAFPIVKHQLDRIFIFRQEKVRAILMPDAI